MWIVLLLSVLFNLLSLSAGEIKCKNPKGELRSVYHNRDCRQSVCAKKDGKAKWLKCEKSVSQDSISDLKKTILEVCGGGMHKFTPMFEFKLTEDTEFSGNEDVTITSHKEGYGTVFSTCASVMGHATVYLNMDQVIVAVSDETMRNDVEELSRYLKVEYQQEFKREVRSAKIKANAAWAWLGISGEGEYSNENQNKYENGLESMNEARNAFSKLVRTHSETESRVTAQAKITGQSSNPIEVCIFYKTESVVFEDNKSVKIIADLTEAKTLTHGGVPVRPDEPIKGEIIPL